jgi:hypothetical protein
MYILHQPNLSFGVCAVFFAPLARRLEQRVEILAPDLIVTGEILNFPP